MISYEPLFETMSKKGISEYYLIEKRGISSSVINRLRHNKVVRTSTIDTLCDILDCDVNEVMRFKKS